jgi:hypothetical protein
VTVVVVSFVVEVPMKFFKLKPFIAITTFALSGIVASACGSSSDSLNGGEGGDGSASCAAGETITCRCDDGTERSLDCVDGTFETCQCGSDPDGSGGGGSNDDAGSGSGGSSGSNGSGGGTSNDDASASGGSSPDSSMPGSGGSQNAPECTENDLTSCESDAGGGGLLGGGFPFGGGSVTACCTDQGTCGVELQTGSGPVCYDGTNPGGGTDSGSPASCTEQDTSACTSIAPCCTDMGTCGIEASVNGVPTCLEDNGGLLGGGFPFGGGLPGP